MFISEQYKSRLKQLAGVNPIEEAIEFSTKDLSNAYDKSNQRIQGFSMPMLLQAIKEGRAIGISYKSEDMPVVKFRVILPVTIGEYNTKSGVKMKLSAFHLAGQSERAAQKTGKRSQETESVWRLFDLDNSKFKSMWFTDKFFYEYPPGYKKGDRRFVRVDEEYDVGRAELYRIDREEKGQKDAEPIQLRGVVPTGPTPAKSPENQKEPTVASPEAKTSEPGAETPLTERGRHALYLKKPWNKFLRDGFKF